MVASRPVGRGPASRLRGSTSPGELGRGFRRLHRLCPGATSGVPAASLAAKVGSDVRRARRGIMAAVEVSPRLTVNRSGEDVAGELFHAEYPRLAGWCRHLVGETETAHDIAAEAFTRLWARWS